MKLKEFLLDFSVTLLVSFAVSVIVTFLYNLIVHNESIPDWGTSVRLSVILSIIFPILHYITDRKRNKLV